MQTIGWYWNRFRLMSLPEVIWRSRNATRQWFGVSGTAPRGSLQRNSSGISVNASIADTRIRSSGIGAYKPRLTAESDSIVTWANEILRNEFTLFSRTYDLGSEVNWNYEPESGRSTPLTQSARIDYRDYRVTGDIKLVWELNRHHHLVPLSIAYRVTADTRYFDAIVRHIDTWIEQCPFGRGVNWRSPLELAIRLINWCWTLSIIDVKKLPPEWQGRVLTSVKQQVAEIVHGYSRFSSANNHLVGEAAGVFITCSVLGSIDETAIWRDQAADILREQIEKQTYADGGHIELSTAYHGFVLELFLVSGIVALHSGMDLGTSFWDRLHSMFNYLAAFREGGRLPMFKDSDDGAVLTFEKSNDHIDDLLAVGAKLFDDRRLNVAQKEWSNRAFWLLGDGYVTKNVGRKASKLPSETRLQSRAFPESGYYFLQSGDSQSSISLAFVCGGFGFEPLVAHAHADALSVTLRIGGVDVLVDPGTFDYFTDSSWRDYFRSTAVHNTVEVDGQDQSQMRGLFLWGQYACARCLRWNPTPEGGFVAGEHNGYRSLSDSVTHRRAISLDARTGVIVIEDHLQGHGNHEARINFQFAEHCKLAEEMGTSCSVDFGAGRMNVTLDSALTTTVVNGTEIPRGGWVSRGYHHKSPAPAISGVILWHNQLTLRTVIEVLKQPDSTPTIKAPKTRRVLAQTV